MWTGGIFLTNSRNSGRSWRLCSLPRALGLWTNGWSSSTSGTHAMNSAPRSVSDSLLLPHLNACFQVTDEEVPPQRALDALLALILYGVATKEYPITREPSGSLLNGRYYSKSLLFVSAEPPIRQYPGPVQPPLPADGPRASPGTRRKRGPGSSHGRPSGRWRPGPERRLHPVGRRGATRDPGR